MKTLKCFKVQSRGYDQITFIKKYSLYDSFSTVQLVFINNIAIASTRQVEDGEKFSHFHSRGATGKFSFRKLPYNNFLAVHPTFADVKPTVSVH
jgi:hypothetical protein